MRTFLLFLIASTLGAQAPESIKNEDKVEIQAITIQIMRIENTIRILQEEHKKLQAQRVKWNRDILVKYDSKDHILDAELNWVKKIPSLDLEEN